uniref:Uncharacterized protein n=1 Tax=Zea mays TaxID=4577 RepID=B8A0K6_MAIZE|nr:unknown [Zea mays]|eukprot:NP_001146331.1 uncharacterized protein LOC100279907 [Zea mays]
MQAAAASVKSSPPRRRLQAAVPLRLRASAVPPRPCPRDNRGDGGGGPQRPRRVPRASVRHSGRRPAGGGGRRAGGDRAPRQDRGVLRHVVGAERDLQHLQQEGAERVPVPVAHVDAVPRRRLRHHARVLGHQDRRGAPDGPRLLEGAHSRCDRAHDRARRGDGEHGQGGRVVHAHHQERGAGIQRARLQVLPRRALPGAGLLLPPPDHRWVRARRRHRAQLQHGWVHGGNDLEPGVRRPDHLLQEGDEGQVRERDELLRLPLHHVAGDPPPLRRRHGGTQALGGGLAASSRRDRPQLRLVGGCAERVLPPVQPGVVHVAGRDLAAHVLHRQHHEEDLRHRRLHHHLPDARPAHQRARSRHRHPRNLHLLPGKAVTPCINWRLDGLPSSVHRGSARCSKMTAYDL